MPTLQSVRSSNATFRPSFRPVALFVGGTSGLGQATAEGFAKYTNGNAHIILCGRNKEAAEKIIAGFPKSPESKYEFVQCDVTLMHNIHDLCADLRSRLTKLNYLVVSQGLITLKGRTETVEGIDRKLALHFYGRWKFVFELLPLLKKAKEEGEGARVMTILAAGKNGKIDWDDIDLKKGFGLKAAADHASTGNDIMVEEIASRNPDLSFTHIYPGFVDTPIVSSGIMSYFKPLIRRLAETPQDAGEWLLHPLLAKEFEKGAFWRDNHADDTGKSKWSTEETRTKLWDHVVSLTNV